MEANLELIIHGFADVETYDIASKFWENTESLEFKIRNYDFELMKGEITQQTQAIETIAKFRCQKETAECGRSRGFSFSTTLEDLAIVH